MKYSIECRVTADIWIGEPISFIANEKEFVFGSENGILNKIVIAKKVINPERFYSVVKVPGGKRIDVSLTGDPEVHEEIMSDFQYLEGCLGMMANLTKIFWNEPTIRWIPETDEEKEKTEVLTAQFKTDRHIEPTKMTIEAFKFAVKSKEKNNDLTITISFYREGRVFFNREEHISAFYDFYFILEDLFGKGAWRNQDIKSNFKASIALKNSIEYTLKKVIDTNDKHKKELLSLLKQENKQYTSEGIIDLLVEMRGHLHHFSRQCTVKQKPSPLEQENYRTLAYLAMSISLEAILKEFKQE